MSQYQFLDHYSLRWTHPCKLTHWLFVVRQNIPHTLQPLESIQAILNHPKGKQFQKSKILFSITHLIWLNFWCFYLICHLDVHWGPLWPLPELLISLIMPHKQCTQCSNRPFNMASHLAAFHSAAMSAKSKGGQLITILRNTNGSFKCPARHCYIQDRSWTIMHNHITWEASYHFEGKLTQPQALAVCLSKHELIHVI